MLSIDGNYAQLANERKIGLQVQNFDLLFPILLMMHFANGHMPLTEKQQLFTW